MLTARTPEIDNMLRYQGTPETVHFANWVLHSGQIGLARISHHPYRKGRPFVA